MHSKRAFTLKELLVVIGTLAVLAIIWLGVFNALSRSRRTTCLGNLKQIDSALQMYLADQVKASLGTTNKPSPPFVSWTNYRQLIGRYVGIKGAPSADDKIFACPADRYYYGMSQNGSGYVPRPFHANPGPSYTSYGFNAGNLSGPKGRTYIGLGSKRFDTVLHPDRTVLLTELPAFFPYSWHEPKRPFSRNNMKFNDAKNLVCFVDGHVSFCKIHYDGKKIAWMYNPPAGYDYQWSGD
jgi:Tfp pilus assembly protein PilE